MIIAFYANCAFPIFHFLLLLLLETLSIRHFFPPGKAFMSKCEILNELGGGLNYCRSSDCKLKTRMVEESDVVFHAHIR